MSLVAICTAHTIEIDESITCNQFAYVEAYLMPTEAEAISSLILNGGIDLEAVGIGFTSVISLWAAGLTVGIILSIIRKVRKG